MNLNRISILFLSPLKPKLVSTIKCLCTSFFSACLLLAGIADCSDNVVCPQQSAQALVEQKQVILLVHGLNNSQPALTPLIEALTRQDRVVNSVVLAGHEKSWTNLSEPSPAVWIDNIREAYCAISAKYGPANISTVGFSLGGLSIARFVQEYPQAKLAKNIYIAPALAINKHIRFMAKPFLWLRYVNLWLPSFTPPDYRVRGLTSVQSYYSTFKLEADFRKAWSVSSALKDIPSLVILREGDELIDNEEVLELIGSLKQESWRSIVFPSFDASGMHQHLMLDEKSMGKHAWQAMLLEINEFIK